MLLLKRCKFLTVTASFDVGKPNVNFFLLLRQRLTAISLANDSQTVGVNYTYFQYGEQGMFDILLNLLSNEATPCWNYPETV